MYQGGSMTTTSASPVPSYRFSSRFWDTVTTSFPSTHGGRPGGRKRGEISTSVTWGTDSAATVGVPSATTDEVSAGKTEMMNRTEGRSKYHWASTGSSSSSSHGAGSAEASPSSAHGTGSGRTGGKGRASRPGKSGASSVSFTRVGNAPRDKQ